MIVIIDIGMGNLRSIRKAFTRIGVESEVVSDEHRIRDASHIVIPGVGHFREGMRRLTQSGLLEVLEYKALREQIPVLGICLGMQLLTERSQEGPSEGLGWIPGATVSFASSLDRGRHRIPHMGWNRLNSDFAGPLLEGVQSEDSFYFVHSYYVMCERDEDVAATTTYGIDFHSAINRGNIWGVQFHPEKSHGQGLSLLRNFARLRS